jgi:hypothetical protein
MQQRASVRGRLDLCHLQERWIPLMNPSSDGMHCQGRAVSRPSLALDASGLDD